MYHIFAYYTSFLSGLSIVAWNDTLHFQIIFELVYYYANAHDWVEVIVRFVDIGGIDDHHCLNFLFIIYVLKY
jgi:hypothetical protein